MKILKKEKKGKKNNSIYKLSEKVNFFLKKNYLMEGIKLKIVGFIRKPNRLNDLE